MSDDLTEIKEERNERSYYTMVPNMIDDMGLSVYAFRLYVRIKRVAADKGRCYQSTRTLADACKMSFGSVSKAKQELIDAGLIRLTPGSKTGKRTTDSITVVDIWAENIRRCSPDEQLDEQVDESCSPDEQPCSPDEQSCSPGETKKNPLRIPPEEEHKTTTTAVPRPEPIPVVVVEALKTIGIFESSHRRIWDGWLSARGVPLEERDVKAMDMYLYANQNMGTGATVEMLARGEAVPDKHYYTVEADAVYDDNIIE